MPRVGNICRCNQCGGNATSGWSCADGGDPNARALELLDVEAAESVAAKALGAVARAGRHAHTLDRDRHPLSDMGRPRHASDHDVRDHRVRIESE